MYTHSVWFRIIIVIGVSPLIAYSLPINLKIKKNLIMNDNDIGHINDGWLLFCIAKRNKLILTVSLFFNSLYTRLGGAV